MFVPGRSSAESLGVTRFGDVFVTRHTLDEGDHWIWNPQRSDDKELLSLFAATSPLTVLPEGRKRVRLQAGSLCALHPSPSTRVVAAGSGVAVSAWFPAAALEEATPGLSLPEVLTAESAIGTGLLGFLMSVLQRPFEPSQYEEHLVRRLIIEMVAGVFIDSAPAESGRDAAYLDRARKLILARCADPTFDVTVLATELFISKRTLQRIVARAGTTTGALLREARVARALSILRSRQPVDTAIETVALQSGFMTATTLRRAFASAGLPTPQEIRREAKAPHPR
jgi:AraC-like DNA-binding protein